MVRATASNFSVQQQVEEIVLIDTNKKTMHRGKIHSLKYWNQ